MLSIYQLLLFLVAFDETPSTLLVGKRYASTIHAGSTNALLERHKSFMRIAGFFFR